MHPHNMAIFLDGLFHHIYCRPNLHIFYCIPGTNALAEGTCGNYLKLQKDVKMCLVRLIQVSQVASCPWRHLLVCLLCLFLVPCFFPDWLANWAYSGSWCG